MDEDDRARIHVNALDPEEMQRKAADHEIRHCAFDDSYLPEETTGRVNRALKKTSSLKKRITKISRRTPYSKSG